MSTFSSEIAKSIAQRKLVIIAGAGVSRAFEPEPPAKSWVDLIRSGLSYCKLKGLITDVQYATYETLTISSDLDDLLSAAEFVVRKGRGDKSPHYDIWLREEFGGQSPSSNLMKTVISSIASAKIPIATTNYDTLLERATGLPPITLRNVPSAFEWARQERPGILHLHGVWEESESCVFGTSDYGNTLKDDVRKLLQQALSGLNRLLFVGCGSTLEDPNFTTLIRWIKHNIGAGAPKHWRLCT